MSEAERFRYVYYMFNKPSGCITADHDRTHATVMDYFREVYAPGLHPVGRLDKDTEGLLLITNDGKWNQNLMHPERHVRKTYFFWAMGEMGEKAIGEIESGIELRGGKARPAEIVIEQKKTLGDIIDIATGIEKGNQMSQPVFSGYITVCEGKKHQIRRMIKAAGCYVVYLKRVSIGNLPLDEGLKPGEFRKLTRKEMEFLFM